MPTINASVVSFLIPKSSCMGVWVTHFYLKYQIYYRSAYREWLGHRDRFVFFPLVSDYLPHQIATTLRMQSSLCPISQIFYFLVDLQITDTRDGTNNLSFCTDTAAIVPFFFFSPCITFLDYIIAFPFFCESHKHVDVTRETLTCHLITALVETSAVMD